MIKNYYLSLILLLSCVFFSNAQLNPGDIAFVQYNADGSDNFAFVALVDIPGNEVIHFTDNEENDLTGGEGTIEWTAPSGGVTCGSVITISTAPFASIGSVSEINDINFAAGGDSILAYQGTTGSPTFIAALSNDGGSWGGTNDGNLPAGLVNGTTAIAIAPEIDNCAYNSTLLTGTKAALLAALNNNSNWTLRNNSTQQTYSGGALTVTDCVVSTDTEVQFTTISSSIIEDGLFIDVCASITNPSMTAATTVDITLNGSSTATNGTDYDDGTGTPAAIVFPQTLTFPANNSSDQCLTIFISNDDNIIESDETIVLNLTNPNGGDSATLGTNTTHTVTITDNDFYDSCTISVTLPVNTNCVNQSFTNVGATDSGIADPGCGAYSGGDVWFNLVVPSSGAVTVETSENGGFTDSGLALYSGSCGSLTLLSCDDDSGDGNMSLITETGLTPGSTVYVRVWEYNNNSFGTFNICAYSSNEIDVERNTFASITNGNAANTGNNTIFTSTEIGNSQTKTYYIRNEGSEDLTVSSITSSNTADFTISLNPAPLTLVSGDFVQFDIEFSPSALGQRNATITIVNNDSDENPYTFGVQGTGECAGGISVTAIPNSGPVNTTVTITGSNLATATATVSGIAAAVNNISATEMEVVIPTGAATGDIEILDDLGCTALEPFTVIDLQITSCDGGTGVVPGNLFISQVTDATYGGLTYVELYNGTGSSINIDDYSIEVIADGSATASPFNVLDLENVIVPNGSTYVIALGMSPDTCSVTGGAGELASSINAQFTSGGINKKTDEHDVIRLVYLGTTIDEFGVYMDNDWMDSTTITGDRGFNFRRSDTATMLPDPTFTLAELGNWLIDDWTGSGLGSCSGNIYSNIGTFVFSSATPPEVTTQPSNPAFACAFSASFTIAGNEGYDDPGDTQNLAYQWYFNAPGSNIWTEILSSNTDYTGQQSATLNVIDTFNLDGYQYYCQLREDSSTCYEASNAAMLNVLKSEWDGTNWSETPAIDRIAIINGNYSTNIHGSFEACSLTVNSSYLLEIRNGTYIEIENDIVADGDITVFPQGSVVQNNDLATVTANGTITVQKETTILNDAYEYTYWSSPVLGETIENVFSTVPITRRFYFEAANFVDTMTEIDNTGTFVPGSDDIDDAAPYDWQAASGTMSPGVGYATTASLAGPFPAPQQFAFVGSFNNGVITTPIVNNSGGAYNDWNFIGNPYPSAINTTDFFSTNSSRVDNAIYLWSQATPANVNASGNEGENFSSADYAVISGSGVNTAGGDLSLVPLNFVPSGQGFFVEAISAGNVIFNNAMRETGNNDQFFRNSDTSDTVNRQVLWINLTSDNGIANQIAVAHIDGATDGYDGTFFDVKRNKSSQIYARLSSIIDTVEDEFVIQGKHISSLNLDEVIKLGFTSSITTSTPYHISIAQFEGSFYSDNPIYLIDKELSVIHDLKSSDYSFNSAEGEFNNRFEIVFRADALSIDDEIINSNHLTITELSNGQVEIKAPSKLTIDKVNIIDVLGREVYRLKGNESIEVYDLSKLSKTAYIAQVTLSNGQVISKKAIKQR